MKNLTFFIIAFIYLTLISYLSLNPFINLNLGLLIIINGVISLILAIIYIKYSKEINELIYKFKKIITLIPIMVILMTFSIIGFNTYKTRSNNKKIEIEYKNLQTYLDLSVYEDNLIYKLDKNNNIKILKEKDGKKYLKEYKPISYNELIKAEDISFTIYQLEDFFLFVKTDEPEKSYLLKSLNDEIFYNINFDYKYIENISKGIYNVTKIKNKKNYQEMKINGKIHLGRQQMENFNIYREYYKDLYSLHKQYKIKTYIKMKFPNYSSVSYSNAYTNVAIKGEEIKKIYASYDENYNLILEEGKKE